MPHVMCLLLIVLALVSPAAAHKVVTERADVYVSPDGDDANPGTREKPVATLDRAAELVRGIRAKDIAEALADQREVKPRVLIVEVSGGRYELSKPIELNRWHSSGRGATLFRGAEDGAVPVFSGGRRITGWKVGDDGV